MGYVNALLGAFLLSCFASRDTVTNAAISSAMIATCIPKSTIGALRVLGRGAARRGQPNEYFVGRGLWRRDIDEFDVLRWAVLRSAGGALSDCGRNRTPKCNMGGRWHTADVGGARCEA